MAARGRHPIGETMARKPASALIAIDIEGLAADPVLRARCARRMRQALAHLGVEPLAARVNFSDQDGPKGGVSIRCAVTVPVPRRAAIHVEHVASRPGTAFDGALDTLENLIAQRRRRERAAGRRPKKYYVAKRALSGELPGPGRTV
jgi:ribosome-associated translation inhibitor RaiA